jgi:hypothetical protein
MLIQQFNGVKMENEKQRNKIFNGFIINNLLLLSGIVTTLSGLVLQLVFHMDESGYDHDSVHSINSRSMSYEQIREIDQNKIVWGFNYSGWSAIHKVFIVVFSLLMIYHIYVHWKWYKGVFAKHLIKKNIQVITLSVLFMLVAITGLVPWFIDISGGTNVLRLIFIEIHDKLTFLLIIYLVLHVVKRNKWFVNAYKKVK